MSELLKALKNFVVRDIIYIIGGSIVILSFLHLHGKIDVVVKYADDDHTAICLILLGLAYALGYCIQETASWIGIVTTGDDFEPGRIRKELYKRFIGREWDNLFNKIKNDDDKKKRRKEIISKLEQADRNFSGLDPDSSIRMELERIISHMQIGTTIGPCAIISGVLLLSKAEIDLTRELYEFFGNPSEFAWIVIAIISVTFLTWVFPIFLGIIAIANIFALTNYSKMLGFDLAFAYLAILVGLFLIIVGRIKSLQLTKQKLDLCHNPPNDY